MNFYDDLVMQTQMNYSRHYHIYASGSTPYQLTDKKPLPYSEQIHRLVQEIKEADCVVVGGASGLSAAGGGDFYYEDNDSYRKYFRPFAEKYHFKGAFAGHDGWMAQRGGKMGLLGPAHPSLLRAVPAYAGDERFEGHCGREGLLCRHIKRRRSL